MKTSEPTKIVVFLLGTYERTGWFTKEILELVYTIPYNMDYATKVLVAHNFSPAAAARNTIARHMIAADPRPDWVCMIDNDMMPPTNLLDTVKNAPEDADVVVPRFYLWDGDKTQATMCWGMHKPNEVDSAFYQIQPGFQRIVTCGTGVIFIRPHVFDKIPAPWFFYTYDENCKMTSTEDINFALKVKDYGLKIYGNGDIEVGHAHTVNISHIAAIQYPPKPAAELAQV